LDTVPPSPNSALLSAEEAGERLREIVEGFFLVRLRTEDGKRLRASCQGEYGPQAPAPITPAPIRPGRVRTAVIAD
jgi:hypothetical protein